jgi:hypothetical protein
MERIARRLKKTFTYSYGAHAAIAKPVRVVAFNVAEGWARDVTQEIAQAVFELGRRENSFSPSAREFVERTLHIALFPTD